MELGQGFGGALHLDLDAMGIDPRVAILAAQEIENGVKERLSALETSQLNLKVRSNSSSLSCVLVSFSVMS
jgi:hypothetical protein